MKKPTLTIGIPAYNEEENIGNLLRSLVSQERKGFVIKEIIVVSDGSTDNTIGEVKAVKSKLIKLVEGKTRKGQNMRQNEIIKLMSKQSDDLLLIEADNLPKDKKFVSHLVKQIPSNGKFSLVVGNFRPTPSRNFFSKIMVSGFNFRAELFKSYKELNLYLCNGPKLLSHNFLKSFTWNDTFHEDSYCYREALQSGLPIYKNPEAVAYYRSIENLNDYLIQSGKFQKAKDREEQYSDIYKLKISYYKVTKTAIKFFLQYPIMFLAYIFVALISRIYSLFLPKYNVFWKIYKSTKKGFLIKYEE